MNDKKVNRKHLRTTGAATLVIGALAVATLAMTPAGAQTEPPPAPTAPTAPPVPVTKKVAVKDNSFKPKSLRVTVGDKVTWKWEGFAIHDVTVTKGPQKFESKKQSSGTFTRTIKKPGSYTIVCTIHPGMEMKLKAT